MGMIKEFVEAFDANREAIKAQLATFQGGYAGLVSLVAAFLPEVDPERVTEVDYGDYQGTLVIVIGAEGYQPWRHWAVSIGYGSCSGCDALEQASEERDAGNLEPLFQLALNIVQELRLVGGNDSEAEAELSALRARVESLQVELDLERAITRGKDERHATLEAPPVVPEGWSVYYFLADASWECTWLGNGGYPPAPPAALRALAWAREHNTRPPHASDGKEGGE